MSNTQPLVPSDAQLNAIVEAVSEAVGHGPMAWDCVPPREIIRAALLASAKQTTGGGEAVAEFIKAAEDVLEKTPCDCSDRRRYEHGAHLSGCHLFDLNAAHRRMRSAPTAPAPSLPSDKAEVLAQAPGHEIRALCELKDRDAITVNLLRHGGLNKHHARDVADAILRADPAALPGEHGPQVAPLPPIEAAPSAEGVPLLGATKQTAVHMAHCFQGLYRHTCKYGFDDCPAAPGTGAQPVAVPDGWRPFGTEPRDGTRFLATCATGQIRLVHWDDPGGDKYPIDDPADTIWDDTPTHWMPLPAAPNSQAKE